MMTTQARMTLMRLSAETTVDSYLLMEDTGLVELLNDGATYATLFEYVNDNY